MAPKEEPVNIIGKTVGLGHNGPPRTFLEQVEENRVIANLAFGLMTATSALSDTRLSARHRAVLAYLLEGANYELDTTVDAAIDAIAVTVGLSKGTTSETIRQLRAWGYIIYTRSTPPDGRRYTFSRLTREELSGQLARWCAAKQIELHAENSNKGVAFQSTDNPNDGVGVVIQHSDYSNDGVGFLRTDNPNDGVGIVRQHSDYPNGGVGFQSTDNPNDGVGVFRQQPDNSNEGVGVVSNQNMDDLPNFSANPNDGVGVADANPNEGVGIPHADEKNAPYIDSLSSRRVGSRKDSVRIDSETLESGIEDSKTPDSKIESARKKSKSPRSPKPSAADVAFAEAEDRTGVIVGESLRRVLWRLIRMPSSDPARDWLTEVLECLPVDDVDDEIATRLHRRVDSIPVKPGTQTQWRPSAGMFLKGLQSTFKDRQRELLPGLGRGGYNDGTPAVRGEDWVPGPLPME